MSAYHVRGELLREDNMVHGWCWSPERPRERLQVALLIDGAKVAAGVAARLRSHLVRGAICDGYHGFSFALPHPMVPSALIEVQEAGSGHVFGRIIASEAADIEEWKRRTEESHRNVSVLHERLGTVWAARPEKPMSSAFGAIGAKLTKADTARSWFSDGLRLSFVSKPVVTLVLDTGLDAERVVASARLLAPLLGHFMTELMVTDDGRSAASESLASLPGLSYCFTLAATRAARANRAAHQARGRLVAFLRAGESSARGLTTLLEYATIQQGVLIGGLAAATAQHAGMSDLIPAASAPTIQTGLSLLTSRETFLSLGALDPTVEDGVDLPMLEFALRARAAGIDAAYWRESVVSMPRPNAGAAEARARFASLWNDRDPSRTQPHYTCSQRGGAPNGIGGFGRGHPKASNVTAHTEATNAMMNLRSTRAGSISHLRQKNGEMKNDGILREARVTTAGRAEELRDGQDNGRGSRQS